MKVESDEQSSPKHHTPESVIIKRDEDTNEEDIKDISGAFSVVTNLFNKYRRTKHENKQYREKMQRLEEDLNLCKAENEKLKASRVGQCQCRDIEILNVKPKVQSDIGNEKINLDYGDPDKSRFRPGFAWYKPTSKDAQEVGGDRITVTILSCGGREVRVCQSQLEGQLEIDRTVGQTITKGKHCHQTCCTHIYDLGFWTGIA